MSNEYLNRYKNSASPVNDFFTGHIASAAIHESVYSGLPGRSDGPADAYRHIILSAELTRRYGESYARAILNAHEFTGNVQDQTTEANQMDIHNNELGIKLGNRLSQQKSGSSWSDVVIEARKLINPNDRNGNGARWLPEDKWRVNPKDRHNVELPVGHKDVNWPPKWENKLYGDEQKRVIRYQDYDTHHDQTSSLNPAEREILWEYYPNLAATNGYVKLAQNTETFEQLQIAEIQLTPYAQAAMNNGRECFTKFCDYYNIDYPKDKLDNIAAAIAAYGRAEDMRDVSKIDVDGDSVLIGHYQPDLVTAEFSLQKALNTPVEESMRQVQAAENKLLQEERERQLAHEMERSRGISIS